MTNTAANLAARFLEARDTIISTMRLIAESVQAISDEDEGDSPIANDRFSHNKAHNGVLKLQDKYNNEIEEKDILIDALEREVANLIVNLTSRRNKAFYWDYPRP